MIQRFRRLSQWVVRWWRLLASDINDHMLFATELVFTAIWNRGSSCHPLMIDSYKNAFVNLAIPFMTVSEPQLPAKKYDHWERQSVAVGNLGFCKCQLGRYHNGWVYCIYKDWIQLRISMLSQGRAILQSFFVNKQKVVDHVKMCMSEVIRKWHQFYLIFEIIAKDINMHDEVELQYTKFHYHQNLSKVWGNIEIFLVLYLVECNVWFSNMMSRHFLHSV